MIKQKIIFYCRNLNVNLLVRAEYPDQLNYGKLLRLLNRSYERNEVNSLKTFHSILSPASYLETNLCF